MHSLIGFDPTHLITAYGYPAIALVVALVSLDEPRLKLGRYLFARHGGKVVFFGRFTALLRALATALAGANGMVWGRFLLFNMAGGVLWAALYGAGGYALGSAVQRIAGPVGIGLTVLAVAAVAAVTVFLRRHEAQLAAEAERAFPGPLAPYARMEAR